MLVGENSKRITKKVEAFVKEKGIFIPDKIHTYI
jgi:hypothetical protein